MKNLLCKLLLIISLGFGAVSCLAADQDDAARAAKEVLTSLSNKQYEKLWTSQMSEFFKSKMTKDSFLANMTLGRQQLGALSDSKFIDMAYSQIDPASGTKGEIYAFNYLNTYSSGKFYERIVVIKEKDAKFRLAGIFGSPAPK